MTDTGNTLAKQTIVVVVIRVATMVSTILFNVILARAFGPQGLGQYYIFVSVVTGLSVIARVGMVVLIPQSE
jgi:O-antigen/teichoic acid export membrane protein